MYWLSWTSASCELVSPEFAETCRGHSPKRGHSEAFSKNDIMRRMEEDRERVCSQIRYWAKAKSSAQTTARANMDPSYPSTSVKASHPSSRTTLFESSFACFTIYSRLSIAQNTKHTWGNFAEAEDTAKRCRYAASPAAPGKGGKTIPDISRHCSKSRVRSIVGNNE